MIGYRLLKLLGLAGLVGAKPDNLENKTVIASDSTSSDSLFNKALGIDIEEVMTDIEGTSSVEEMKKSKIKDLDAQRVKIIQEVVSKRSSAFKLLQEGHRLRVENDKDKKYLESLKEFDLAIQMMQENRDVLISDFYRKRAFNNNLAQMHNGRANVKSSLKMEEDSILDHDIAIDLDSRAVWFNSDKANVLVKLERYQEAISFYETELEINDSDEVREKNDKTVLLLEEQLLREEKPVLDYNRKQYFLSFVALGVFGVFLFNKTRQDEIDQVEETIEEHIIDNNDEGEFRHNAEESIDSFARGLLANIIKLNNDDMNASLSKIEIIKTGEVDLYCQDRQSEVLDENDKKNVVIFFNDVLEEFYPHFQDKTFISQYARPRETGNGRADLLTDESFIRFSGIFALGMRDKLIEFTEELFNIKVEGETREVMTNLLNDVVDHVENQKFPHKSTNVIDAKTLAPVVLKNPEIGI